SVNAMLGRVDGLVAELTIATDGLAHDLKSPLTRLRSALERAAAAVTEPAAQDAVDRALAEGERLLAMVETALRITRAEAGIGKESFTPVDLAVELEEIAEIYGPTDINERHRHRYEVNINYRQAVEEKGGLFFAGLSPDGVLPETVERKDHPWFIGVQYHPEYRSRPFAPHPLFASFVEAALVQSRLV
ncbi:hypothetical protein LTR94_029040, partial [Friedmanniomyces endolithicus]